MDDLLLAIVSSCSFFGCMDADPFNLNKKSVAGDYYLNYFPENNQYYLDKKHVNKSACGILDGVIIKIGWTENTILAKVKRCYRGDPDGWYTIDVVSGDVNGPFEMKYISTNNILSRIKCYIPEDASITI